MYDISTSLYNKVAERLISSIGTKEYYSGSLHLCHDGVDCTLRCTLIIKRNAPCEEGNCFKPITALIPVWWEFHTYKDGNELLNGFSFRDLVAQAL